MIHRTALLAACLLAVIPAYARVIRIQGTVVDRDTRESIPYVAVALTGTPAGVQTDEAGKFTLTSYAMNDSIRFSVLGYTTLTLPVDRSSDRSKITVEMAPTGVQLSEVVVKPRKEKYSKKNNPAVAFMERIRATSGANDPRRHPYYGYQKYERMTMAINDYNPSDSAWVNRRFKFLRNYVDTSDVSGKPILNISLREKSSQTNYRKSPRSEHEHVIAMRQEGIDDISNKDGVRQALEDVFREIDIYSNDITLLQNRFVSPLSRIAADFYKFYLTDTMVVEGDSCVVLSFVPHTPQTWGFIGKLYVPKGDSTMFIKKIDMYLPHTINVNYIDGMVLSQTFRKDADGTRLKMKDDLTMEFSVLPMLPKLYVRRHTVYHGHNYDMPTDTTILEAEQYEVVAPDAYDQSPEYWTTHRMVPLQRGEAGVGQMVAFLRNDRLFYWTEETLKIIAGAYIHTGDPSKFDYGPVINTVSYNTAEGLRMRIGGMTTAALSKRWFTRGFVAYGMKDHKLKYSAEVEYSFNDKKLHSREFPVHSLRFTSLYELDQLGQQYLSTGRDNLFLSVKRTSDTRVTYRRIQELDYTLELMNNFSLVATAKFERQEPSPWIRFVDGFGREYSHYNEAAFRLELRYAPGEKFVQSRTGRKSINLDAPVFSFSHTFAPKGFLGSKFTINRTEIRYQQRYWLSAFGYIDAIVKGGHVWNTAPYLNLLLPNANISYTIQSEGYALMNPLEFINDSYASLDVTYWMNGLIMNRIPWVNKLRLREVINFKSLWGHLSDRNKPELHPELFRFPSNITVTPMTSNPYMEFSVGLDNVLRLFRIDYVWRLSYRNAPDAPNSGLRFSFHLTF